MLEMIHTLAAAAATREKEVGVVANPR